MMDKFDRIQKLFVNQFNVPTYVKITRENIDKLDEIGGFTWSLRTQPTPALRVDWKQTLDETLPQWAKDLADKSPGVPHFPFVTGREATFISAALLSLGFDVLTCKGINPINCMYAGAAFVERDSVTLELAKGTMVRRVTVDGEIDLRIKMPPVPSSGIGKTLSFWLFRLMKSDDFPKPLVAELSYYTLPVGAWKERVIFWDWHKASEYKEWDSWIQQKGPQPKCY
jgi:hypothetical protein